MAQVTLFSDRQFAGSSVPLDEGDTRFSSDFNDTASSIRVAPGYCAMLYEHANEFSGYGAWVDLLEDCPDLAVYGFDKKTSYVHVFRAERDGFVWARGAMRDGQFIPGHWERKRASGVSPNSAVAVVAPPLPPRTTPRRHSRPPGRAEVRHLHHGQFRDLEYPIAA
jgi:phospholipase C